ncbi:UDP-N-acetylmuramate--alanine ligase [Algoriella xinjiangensis]|uniref:UDP-N-acetylmuramate--L-alanine ligase n=1 Tax=Algoriella xinjiangensis TaxID=684065 RepID=A0A1I4URS3_9FLAO|nr:MULTISPECIES: UDP-N-acetylmuramate--L-alanine ligase [Algoriella]MBO6211846.1 UDP-N-acetylmuramate--L-alanine ligase [Algoriella sp.]SFM91662.1 UDP-N-acetylmuramate--alanine ligase [Algoriella xinjiangensis]VDH18214.1 UDP-N-acetylmuramate--L-alanine ligase [Algoriella xinjiangensis]
MNILDKTYYYFIGAGGIGMSALERFFKSIGKNVAGYDKTQTELTAELIAEGIDIHFEDNIDLIPSGINKDNTLVIYTPAVPKDLTLLNYFLVNDFKVMKRSEVLGEITKHTYNIGVAGTHGKTTTSSILGHILKVADLECTAFLGGIAENYDSNIISNGSKYTVAEADEFDRSFLRLSPKLAIITSDDADHLDIYGERDEVKKSFQEFGNIVEEKLFVHKGLPFDNALTYGVDLDADYNAYNVRIIDGHYVFDVKTPNGILTDIGILLPGHHNMENAVAALAVADYMGVSHEKIKEALSTFIGVKRRFNRFEINGKIYIDDYAHHPTELNAAIRSVRELYPGKKVLGVFQPHLFTRTRDFVDEFAQSLSQLDSLILLDIYPARELPIEGVTSNWLLEKVDLNEKIVSSLEDCMENIKKQDFDVLLTVGAGNIDTIVKPIKKWLGEA